MSTATHPSAAFREDEEPRRQQKHPHEIEGADIATLSAQTGGVYQPNPGENLYAECGERFFDSGR